MALVLKTCILPHLINKRLIFLQNLDITVKSIVCSL